MTKYKATLVLDTTESRTTETRLVFSDSWHELSEAMNAYEDDSIILEAHISKIGGSS